jgi:hypothetical protein
MDFVPFPKSQKFLDRTGVRYGRLVPLGYVGDGRWLCQCDCGAQKVILGEALGCHTLSCGCLRDEKIASVNFGHGKTGSPEYIAWLSMRRRCCDPTDDSFLFYGARDIKVCERWKNSFDNFLADMGSRPSPDHSLERIDSNKDYSPDNCRWATRSEQSRNKRSNQWITFDGETMIVTDWARRLGIKRTTLEQRINSYGWSVERALTTPVRPRRKGH